MFLLQWVLLAFWFCVFVDCSHSNNWAVLIDTSRYWYNYRHVANTLSFYRTIKRLGISDSNIILMLAEDIACDAQNVHPGSVFNDAKHGVNLYGTNVEVDYRGDDVSTENFLRLFTGRHSPLTPRSKRLMSDSRSNVFVFMAGHSGSRFVKVQDWEEVTSMDLADAFNQMKLQGRFQNLFWIADTCQAETLQNDFYTEGILGLGSSAAHENSYSHHVDYDIGVAIIDRFTFYSLKLFEGLSTDSNISVFEFVNTLQYNQLHSHPTLRTDLFRGDVRQTKLSFFLANDVQSSSHRDFSSTEFSINVDSSIEFNVSQRIIPMRGHHRVSVGRASVSWPPSTITTNAVESHWSTSVISQILVFLLVLAMFRVENLSCRVPREKLF